MPKKLTEISFSKKLNECQGSESVMTVANESYIINTFSSMACRWPLNHSCDTILMDEFKQRWQSMHCKQFQIKWISGDIHPNQGMPNKWDCKIPIKA